MRRDIIAAIVGGATAAFIGIAAELLFGALSSLLGPPVPRGAVVAFAGACPKTGDWELYVEGKGRFLLGAGQTNDEGKNYGMGTEGGEASVKLELAEMPKHRHDDIQGAGEANHLLVQVNGEHTEAKTDSHGHRQINVRHGVRMAARGEGKPHENMPPYRVVSFCEKK